MSQEGQTDVIGRADTRYRNGRRMSQKGQTDVTGRADMLQEGQIYVIGMAARKSPANQSTELLKEQPTLGGRASAFFFLSPDSSFCCLFFSCTLSLFGKWGKKLQQDSILCRML